jgi:hypothetical protein
MAKYWVGKLKDGRLVLYDPEAQVGKEDSVRLFVYNLKRMEDFPKITTRQSIKPYNKNPNCQMVIDRYLSHQIETKRESIPSINESKEKGEPAENNHQSKQSGYEYKPDNTPDMEEPGDPRFDDLREEIERDVNRYVYRRYHKETDFYTYSTEDSDGLESDDFLDDGYDDYDDIYY